MGIPSYFSYIVKNHPEIIQMFVSGEFPIDNLYMDCNSIIYDCYHLLSEDELEEGYELITYQEHKLLKNTENRKLYYLDDKGKKGKYAGKESSKGKIKLKE